MTTTRMTSREFQSLYGNPQNHPPQLARPKPKRPTGDDALEKALPKEADSRRFSVVITSYRRRLLDEDNLCGKFHCDLLRYSGIIPSDAPAVTTIKNNQVKVSKKDEEKTVIEVILVN